MRANKDMRKLDITSARGAHERNAVCRPECKERKIDTWIKIERERKRVLAERKDRPCSESSRSRRISRELACAADARATGSGRRYGMRVCLIVEGDGRIGVAHSEKVSRRVSGTLRRRKVL